MTHTPLSPANRRYWYSLSLVLAGTVMYLITKNGDLAILHLLGAIWIKLP